MNAQTLPLRSIHWPSTVDWWPLAVGWWGVIALLLCGLIFAGVFLNCWWQRRGQRVRIEARQSFVLKQVAEIKKQFHTEHNPALACAALSCLLRQLCLQYFPRVEFASLHGTPWLEFLQSKHPWTGSLSLLATLTYQTHGTASSQEINRLLSDAEDWMMAVMVQYD
ncbi:MAG: DUF4381 domain-containing protein [Mariprofundaceae bacterium]|nr:DUF4381 domain-containing protein [Mariprofundaceae bacterium]